MKFKRIASKIIALGTILAIFFYAEGVVYLTAQTPDGSSSPGAMKVTAEKDGLKLVLGNGVSVPMIQQCIQPAVRGLVSPLCCVVNYRCIKCPICDFCKKIGQGALDYQQRLLDWLLLEGLEAQLAAAEKEETGRKYIQEIEKLKRYEILSPEEARKRGLGDGWIVKDSVKGNDEQSREGIWILPKQMTRKSVESVVHSAKAGNLNMPFRSSPGAQFTTAGGNYKIIVDGNGDAHEITITPSPDGKSPPKIVEKVLGSRYWQPPKIIREGSLGPDGQPIYTKTISGDPDNRVITSVQNRESIAYKEIQDANGNRLGIEINPAIVSAMTREEDFNKRLKQAQAIGNVLYNEGGALWNRLGNRADALDPSAFVNAIAHALADLPNPAYPNGQPMYAYSVKVNMENGTLNIVRTQLDDKGKPMGNQTITPMRFENLNGLGQHGDKWGLVQRAPINLTRQKDGSYVPEPNDGRIVSVYVSDPRAAGGIGKMDIHVTSGVTKGEYGAIAECQGPGASWFFENKNMKQCEKITTTYYDKRDENGDWTNAHSTHRITRRDLDKTGFWDLFIWGKGFEELLGPAVGQPIEEGFDWATHKLNWMTERWMNARLGASWALCALVYPDDPECNVKAKAAIARFMDGFMSEKAGEEAAVGLLLTLSREEWDYIDEKMRNERIKALEKDIAIKEQQKSLFGADYLSEEAQCAKAQLEGQIADLQSALIYLKQMDITLSGDLIEQYDATGNALFYYLSYLMGAAEKTIDNLPLLLLFLVGGELAALARITALTGDVSLLTRIALNGFYASEKLAAYYFMGELAIHAAGHSVKLMAAKENKDYPAQVEEATNLMSLIAVMYGMRRIGHGEAQKRLKEIEQVLKESKQRLTRSKELERELKTLEDQGLQEGELWNTKVAEQKALADAQQEALAKITELAGAQGITKEAVEKRLRELEEKYLTPAEKEALHRRMKELEERVGVEVDICPAAAALEGAESAATAINDQLQKTTEMVNQGLIEGRITEAQARQIIDAELKALANQCERIPEQLSKQQAQSSTLTSSEGRGVPETRVPTELSRKQAKQAIENIPGRPEGEFDMGGGQENMIESGHVTGEPKFIVATDLHGKLPYDSGARPAASIGDLPQTPGEVPQIRNIEFPSNTTFLVSEVHSGSAGAVVLGYMDGRPVAMKAYYTEPVNPDATPQQRAAVEDVNLNHLHNEYKGAKIAEAIGYGPKVHGFYVDGGTGKTWLVTDIVAGDFPEIPSGKNFNPNITVQTVRDMIDLHGRVDAQGRTIDFDFQYLVTPEGRVQMIDAAGLRNAASSPQQAQEFAARNRRVLIENIQALLENARPEIREQIVRDMGTTVEGRDLLNDLFNATKDKFELYQRNRDRRAAELEPVVRVLQNWLQPTAAIGTGVGGQVAGIEAKIGTCPKRPPETPPRSESTGESRDLPPLDMAEPGAGSKKPAAPEIKLPVPIGIPEKGVPAPKPAVKLSPADVKVIIENVASAVKEAKELEAQAQKKKAEGKGKEAETLQAMADKQFQEVLDAVAAMVETQLPELATFSIRGKYKPRDPHFTENPNSKAATNRTTGDIKFARRIFGQEVAPTSGGTFARIISAVLHEGFHRRQVISNPRAGVHANLEMGASWQTIRALRRLNLPDSVAHDVIGRQVSNFNRYLAEIIMQEGANLETLKSDLKAGKVPREEVQAQVKKVNELKGLKMNVDSEFAAYTAAKQKQGVEKQGADPWWMGAQGSEKKVTAPGQAERPWWME